MPGPVRDPSQAFQQLESIMLRQMLQSSGAFKASSMPGAQLRTDMFMETLADAVAKAGGLGIAKMLERQLGASAGAAGAAGPGGPAGSTPGLHPLPKRDFPAGATLEHVRGNAFSGAVRAPTFGHGTAETAATDSQHGIDELDDPNSDAPLPEDPSAASIDEYQEVTGEVTSAFGPRIHPITGDSRFHTGVDLRAPEGTPIRAAAGGVVIDAGARGGYGNTVEIDHGNGTKTLYAHASTVLVRKGQRVDPDQPIAMVGQTGQATGPHLHFEVRRNDHPVDPLSGRAPISIARALNRYRERAEVPGAGIPTRAGSGDEP